MKLWVTLAFPGTLRLFPKFVGKICAHVTKPNFSNWNRITKSNTYLLTPWCRFLLEKLTGLQLVKKFPAFHGTRKFITALTSVRHLSLSWASPIQSIYPHPTSWRSILILSTHLRLGLPSGLIPSGFLTKNLYTTLSSPIRATCPAHTWNRITKINQILYFEWLSVTPWHAPKFSTMAFSLS